jgi:hypothetical protein
VITIYARHGSATAGINRSSAGKSPLDADAPIGQEHMASLSAFFWLARKSPVVQRIRRLQSTIWLDKTKASNDG